MSQTLTFQHFCGTCQIRVYIQRHYGILLDTKNCPYTCDYKDTVRKAEKDEEEE